MNRRRRKLRPGFIKFALCCALALVVVILLIARGIVAKNGGKPHDDPSESAEAALPPEPTPREQYISDAALLAAQYDYDAAMDTLKMIPGWEADVSIQQSLSDYQAQKDACVPVDITQVTHIFYHSLVVDPDRGFSGENADGFNQWMTTVEEFNSITQQMYDRGYVLVSLHDLAHKGGDGNMTAGTIMLPPDRKAYVLSQDDLSYYHSYDGHGTASKMILDERGKPVCEYYDAEGTLHVGAYDVVPLMDAFIEQHPDASYRGAKGIIALTGYDGILGYRTDDSYKTGEELGSLQSAWLAAHPDFNFEAECAEAKKVAAAMKEDGWEFASHTWGHINVGSADLSWLQTDTQKWLDRVAPLIGGTDAIIFAFGSDLGDWHEYGDNAKFQYLKGLGFDYYCNVDSSQYWVQMTPSYFRMGRRNLDGYRMYYDLTDDSYDILSDIFDVSTAFDWRRPTPVPPL